MGSSATASPLYICAKESYDAMLDIEKWGIKVRDVDNLFVGAPFRDEKTKLMFAYDYDNNFTVRVQAGNVKPAMQKEMKRLGVKNLRLESSSPASSPKAASPAIALPVLWASTCTPANFISLKLKQRLFPLQSPTASGCSRRSKRAAPLCRSQTSPRKASPPCGTPVLSWR